MVEYGPLLTVARFTLYAVAPLTAFQASATCAFPAVAVTPVGVPGGVTTAPVGAVAIARKALFVPAVLMIVVAVPASVPLKPEESVSVTTGVPAAPLVAYNATHLSFT